MNRRVKAVCLGCLVLLGLLEIGGRIWLTSFASAKDFTRYAPSGWVPKEHRRYRAHPYTAFSLNENFRSRDGRNRHNSIGYRGDEVTWSKPAGVYRILVLGGSTTYETGVPEHERTFPAQLQRILCERRGRSDVEVINAGCPQWNSWESLVDLQFRGLALDPDLVIVYCGTNEIFPRLVPHDVYRRDNVGYRKGWVDHAPFWERSVALRGLGLLIGTARANSLSAMCEIDYDGLSVADCLDANGVGYFESNLEHMIAVSRHAGVRIMISNWAWCGGFEGDYASDPDYQRGFRETNDASRRVAGRNQVPFFDHVAEMPTEKRYWHDGRHVNATGALVKAEQFATFVEANFLPRI
jgi:hypothetical protein